MNSFEPVIEHPQDHIMANTWRLIIERQSRLKPVTLSSPPDFNLLEQVLPEYRLIGLCLVENKQRRPN